MTEGMNKAILIGNLGQDPELRYTQAGQPVLNMRLATTETYLNRDRERQQRTEWHSVIVWGKRGEALHKILSKGRTVCVEGRLQTRKWEDKEGNKRYLTEIVATHVIVLGGRAPGAADYSGAEAATMNNRASGDDLAEIPADINGGFGEDDDTPF
jgi:single-strand DNA-binding protein